VLVDFGLLARFGGSISREVLDVSVLSAGTLGYMAPEQIRRQFLDARADLYTLGCMLYEVVTGRPPFVAALPAQLLDQHLHSEPDAPSSLAEDVPPELDELILRLLRKDPRDRLGYASDVARVLDQLGAREWDEARPLPQARSYLYRLASAAGRPSWSCCGSGSRGSRTGRAASSCSAEKAASARRASRWSWPARRRIATCRC
jgi:serine/threonine protein kinase